MALWESTQEKGFYLIDTIFKEEFIKKIKEEFPDNIYNDVMEVKLYLAEIEDNSLDFKNQEVVTLSYPTLTSLMLKELYVDADNHKTLDKIKEILEELENNADESIKDLIKQYQDSRDDIEGKLIQKISDNIDSRIDIIHINAYNDDHCFKFVMETNGLLDKIDIDAIENLGFKFDFDHIDNGIFLYIFTE